MITPHYVYVLRDELGIRWVGVTMRPAKRAQLAALRSARNDDVRAWAVALTQKPKLEVQVIVGTREDGERLEGLLIQLFRARGEPLLNHYEGGYVKPAGYGEAQSQKLRGRRLSTGRTGTYDSEAVVAQRKIDGTDGRMHRRSETVAEYARRIGGLKK